MKNIEAERGRLLMPKFKFCQEIGVSVPTYNKQLQKKAPISSETLKKMRLLTNKSLDYLLKEFY